MDFFSRDPEALEGVKHRTDADGDAIGVGIAPAKFLQGEVHLLAEQCLHVQLALDGDGMSAARLARLWSQLAGFDEEFFEAVNGVGADLEECGRLADAVREGIAEHPGPQIK